MTRIAMFGLFLVAAVLTASGPAEDRLAAEFAAPPDSAKPWVYWWWLNGYVTKDGMVRDLDTMKRLGISGALVFHAGSGPTPKQTDFMSRPWRDLFRFAVEEAGKRRIEIGLNICAGWNAGGPWVRPENAAKTLVHAMTRMSGPIDFDDILPSLMEWTLPTTTSPFGIGRPSKSPQGQCLSEGGARLDRQDGRHGPPAMGCTGRTLARHSIRLESASTRFHEMHRGTTLLGDRPARRGSDGYTFRPYRGGFCSEMWLPSSARPSTTSTSTVANSAHRIGHLVFGKNSVAAADTTHSLIWLLRQV
jgi:hypothetical protein